MFIELTPAQEKAFRGWARQNYKPGAPINSMWHPVVQNECEQINEEIEEDKLTEQCGVNTANSFNTPPAEGGTGDPYEYDFQRDPLGRKEADPREY